MTQSLRQAAGSLLVVGLGGTELTGLERAWLKLVRPAGIILFRRNIADRDADAGAARRSDAASARRMRALRRCGRRNGGPAARCAGADAFGAGRGAGRARQRGTALHWRASTENLIARAVKAFGFNTTLAPVLDLALPESRRVMGTRCAGANGGRRWWRTRASFWRGWRRRAWRVAASIFPGLGGGTLDSHLETPAIRRTWQQMWQEDLGPIARCAANCRW